VFLNKAFLLILLAAAYLELLVFQSNSVLHI
jgi:hypothetical protein